MGNTCTHVYVIWIPPAAVLRYSTCPLAQNSPFYPLILLFLPPPSKAPWSLPFFTFVSSLKEPITPCTVLEDSFPASHNMSHTCGQWSSSVGKVISRCAALAHGDGCHTWGWDSPRTAVGKARTYFFDRFIGVLLPDAVPLCTFMCVDELLIA